MRSTLAVGLLVLCLVSDGAGRGPHRLFDDEDVGTSLPLIGILRPSRTLELGFPVEGRIEQLSFERGERVERGDLIARLGCAVELATLAIAEARADADAAEESARVSVERAGERVAQLAELLAKRVISREELTEAETELRLAQLQLRQAEQDRAVARLEADQVRARLAQRHIVSGVDGVVTERLLSEGELVSASSNSAVVRIAVLDPLQVEVIVPASAFGRLRVGDRATVVPLGLELSSYEATVTVVDPLIDARSHTFVVQLEFSNPEYLVPAGIECRVEFPE